jgi:hypothetical protein
MVKLPQMPEEFRSEDINTAAAIVALAAVWLSRNFNRIGARRQIVRALTLVERSYNPRAYLVWLALLE